ncbi:MAG: hypothetical protein PUB19_03225 [Lachnospiraceae bacterium]|nr:hypothetical protein [Lachnospiraceae bacterium]
MIAEDFFHDDMTGDRVDIERSIELYQIELENFVNQHRDEDLQEAPFQVQNEAGYLLYTLGKNFYLIEDYTTAAEYFETGLAFNLNVKDDYVIEMVLGYGFSLLNSNQGRTGVVLEAVCDDFEHLADFCFMMGMVYLDSKQYEQAIIEFAKAVEGETGKIAGAQSYLSYYYAGIAREKQNRPSEAREFFEKAAPHYEDAAKKLDQI